MILKMYWDTDERTPTPTSTHMSGHTRSWGQKQVNNHGSLKGLSSISWPSAYVNPNQIQSKNRALGEEAVFDHSRDEKSTASCREIKLILLPEAPHSMTPPNNIVDPRLDKHEDSRSANGGSL